MYLVISWTNSASDSASGLTVPVSVLLTAATTRAAMKLRCATEASSSNSRYEGIQDHRGSPIAIATRINKSQAAKYKDP